jgi:hypothetical protein
MRTAMIPVRNTPSKVPAPPILAIDSPILPISRGFVKSAPISAPKDPEMYAITAGSDVDKRRAKIAAAMGGINAGVTIRRPPLSSQPDARLTEVSPGQGRHEIK